MPITHKSIPVKRRYFDDRSHPNMSNVKAIELTPLFAWQVIINKFLTVRNIQKEIECAIKCTTRKEKAL